MIKLVSMTVLILVATMAIPFSGCGQPSAPVPDSAVPSTVTFGEYATLGESVFAQMGASCHGSEGQGGNAPALWGSSASLAKYNTAQALLDFISTTMPANAPGTLSQQDYLYVLSYLLVENNFVSPDAAFDKDKLSTLALK